MGLVNDANQGKEKQLWIIETHSDNPHTPPLVNSNIFFFFWALILPEWLMHNQLGW